jgi:hypothetical protein
VLATASLQTGRFTLVEALLCGARIAQLSEDPGRTLEMLIWAIEIAREEIILPFIQVQANSIIRRVVDLLAPVHGHVDYLCKTTQSLCAPWEMLGIVQPAVALNRAFTWEPAVRALCIKRKL